MIDGCRELDRETRAAGLSRDFTEGVLFLTYATLVSRTSRGSRLEQIVEWFGGESADGCLLLDECHKAKNFNAGRRRGLEGGGVRHRAPAAVPGRASGVLQRHGHLGDWEHGVHAAARVLGARHAVRRRRSIHLRHAKPRRRLSRDARHGDESLGKVRLARGCRFARRSSRRRKRC